MNLKELRQYCLKVGKERPDCKNNISDIFAMAYDEVADGGSEAHECELAYDEIQDLLNDEED